MSDFLAAAGVLVAAAAAAGAILLPAGRPRAAAMLVALVLFPLLILGDQWHSPQIVDLRDDTGRLVALAVAALAVAVGAGVCLPPLADPAAAGDRRRPFPSASRCTPAATPPTCSSPCIW